MKTTHFLPALCLVTLLFAPARTTTAQTAAPVPAPTVITSAPYTINASGYYQLGANLNYNGTGAADEAIITINASNVTLDFGGHYIAGPGNSPGTKLYGVYANERANLLIKDGTISSCFLGLQLVGNGTSNTNHRNTRVLNMTLTKCYAAGANIFYGVGAEMAGCRISSIGGSTYFVEYAIGVDLSGSLGGKVSGTAISNVATGTSKPAYGIRFATYAVGNQITNCQYGFFQCTKYKDSLTSGCTTAYYGGNDAGGNY